MEKLAKIDMEYEKGYLYFIKKFDDGIFLCRTLMNKDGRRKRVE
jgi:hypothetical protein